MSMSLEAHAVPHRGVPPGTHCAWLRNAGVKRLTFNFVSYE